MDLSIIILNYNAGDFLASCLRAAREGARGLDYEVTVVDNASDDGSLVRARQTLHADTGIRWIANAQNLGFARGNNPAISQSHARWVVLLNPDTQVHPGALEVMVRSADTQADVGIVGGKLLYPDGQFQWACRRKVPTPLTALARLVGRTSHYNYPDDPDREMEVEAISGSFMLVRQQVFAQIGLLDEDFFMYGEDLDFCLRARRAGWKVLYQPRAVAIHAKGESSRRGSYKALYEYYRAMWVFYRKHYSHKQPAYVNATVYIGVVLLAAIGLASYPFKSDKRIGSRYS